MNNFEFLRNITIGTYLPTGSLVHRLDPRARMLGVLLLLMAVTFAPHLYGLAWGLVVALVVLRMAQVPYRYALRGLLPPLPFLVFLAVLQFFFNARVDVPPVFLSFRGLVLSAADLEAAGMLLVRFAVLVLVISLATFTLTTSELTQGTALLLAPLARMGLPVNDFVMVVQVTLRFLPLLAQSAERIAKAQASRGADWDARGFNLVRQVRQILPVILPLFLLSLHRAESMAVAMDARAFGSGSERTSMYVFRFTRRDTLSVLLAFAAGLGVFLL